MLTVCPYVYITSDNIKFLTEEITQIELILFKYKCITTNPTRKTAFKILYEC